MLNAVLNQVLLTWRLLFDKRVPVWMKAIALAPVIYVLSPFDFIPDFLIGLGQLDDLGLILVGMRLFESLVPEAIVREYRDAIERGKPGDAVTTVEGRSRPIEREGMR